MNITLIKWISDLHSVGVYILLSLHWMMMAESGELEIGEVAGSEEAEAKPTGGKCPFSGQLKEMGFDMDKMSSDMSEKNPHS